MTTPLRLLGALFAIALLATACGESTATETANDATSSDAAAVSDDALTDDAMSDESTSDDETHEGHDDGHGGHDGHGAKTIDITDGAAVPEVAIELTETDTPGTFDLAVSLTNFTITPENVDGDPIDNEGHMHLLIDGEKVERFTELERQVMVPEGDHLVEVELNANNHAAYAIDGTAIRAGKTVTGHGAMAMDDTDDDAAHGHDDHGHHGEAGPGIEEGLAMGDATVSRTATYTAGSVELDGDDRIEAAVGDIVMVMINSDVSEQAHLHGYDVLIDVEAGTPATFLFTADTPGKFEIEFEQSGTFIAELVVS